MRRTQLAARQRQNEIPDLDQADAPPKPAAKRAASPKPAARTTKTKPKRKAR